MLLEWLVGSVMLYALAGLIFATFFAWRGVEVVDPLARRSTAGFRLIIIPGAILLWPMLAARWRSAVVSAAAGRTGPEVPGDRLDLWSERSERLRGFALTMWIVLGPIVAASLTIALLARRVPAPPSPDASLLPGATPPHNIR